MMGGGLIFRDDLAARRSQFLAKTKAPMKRQD
jgi:hypothetical protein